MVNKNGGKISIDFYDDLVKHNIASFDSELKTSIYLNTLYFFPSAESSEILEFNPR